MGLDTGRRLTEALLGAAHEIRSGGGLRQDHVEALSSGAALLRGRLGAEGAALADLVLAIASRIEARNHGASMLGDHRLLLDSAIETRVLAQALFQAFHDTGRETR